MVSPRYIATFLERVCLLDLHPLPRSGRPTLRSLFTRLHQCFLCGLCGFHLYITCSKCVRYRPELFESLYEDAFLLVSFLSLAYLQLYHAQCRAVLDLIDKSFSTSYPRIMEAYTRRCRSLFVAVFTIFSGAGLLNVAETFLPLSEQEAEIRRTVYGTNFPNRRYPYHVYIFTNEGPVWAFHLLYAVFAYVMALFVCVLTSMATMIPVILIYLEAQYAILVYYVRQIGSQHRAPAGSRDVPRCYLDIETNEFYPVRGHRHRGAPIRYTDIEKNTFNLERDKDGAGRRYDAATLEARRRAYELDYIRQIVRYHQKLLVFREKFTQILKPIMIILVLQLALIMSLALYQLMFFDPEASRTRLVRLVMDLAIINIVFFTIMNMSEQMDNCNGSLRRALTHCAWHRVSPRAQRHLCIIVRRVQASNHLVFYDGALVLSRATFLRLVRSAYTFVNFMRL